MYPNPQAVLPLPGRPSLEQYKKRAKELVKASSSGDSGSLRNWIETWIKDLARLAQPNDLAFSSGSLAGQLEAFTRSRIEHAKLSLANGQFVVARAHGFESWPKFTKHITALAQANSSTSAFEMAADAIVSGNLNTLRKLLHENPELVRLRSTREHEAALLIYVAANGVENYRQRTPSNIVAITKLLLEAGAAVNASANIHGGTSTN